METSKDQERQQQQMQDQSDSKMQRAEGSQNDQGPDQHQSQQQSRNTPLRQGGSGSDGRIQADHGVISSQMHEAPASRGSRNSQHQRQSASISSAASRPSRASNGRSDSRAGQNQPQQISSASLAGTGNEQLEGGIQGSATNGQSARGGQTSTGRLGTQGDADPVEHIQSTLQNVISAIGQQSPEQIDLLSLKQNLQSASQQLDQYAGDVSRQMRYQEQASAEMNLQMSEQQEEFFKRIQEREDEVETLKQQIAALQSAPSSEPINLELQAEARREVDLLRSQVDEQAADETTYQEEEQQAKKRKETDKKFTKACTSLQNLLEKVMVDQTVLSQRLEAVQLIEALQRLMTYQTQENKSLQLSRIKSQSKVKSLNENIKYLEERLSSMLSEKEEQAIKLKSEIIICQQKAKQYKEKMVQQKEQYDSQNESVMAERVELAKKDYIEEMTQIQAENQRQKAELVRLTDENRELSDRNKEFEKEYVDVVKEKDDMIQSLESKLQKIDLIHEKRLNKIGTKQDDTRKKLAIEEKDKELFGLKLEQVMVNNKKLMLQKKFLEKQLEKDLREIHLEMNKIQIEIQQDQLMNSSSALQRFRSVYQAVSDQLTYVQQIVGFMDFDQEGSPGEGRLAAHSGGKQPQSYDDVVKEINEKFQPGRRPESSQGLPDAQAQVASDDVVSATSPFSQGAPHGQSLHSQSYDPNQEVMMDPGMADMNYAGFNQTNFAPNPNAGMGQMRHRSMIQQQQRPLVGGQIGGPQQGLLTVEECLNSYPNELLYAVLEVLNETFKDAKIFESEHIQRFMELIQGQITDRGVISEIYDKFLHQNRVQFSQYFLKLNEKCRSLEIERKNLQLKVKRAKLDMRRIEQSESTQQQRMEEQDGQYDDGYENNENMADNFGMQQISSQMEHGADERIDEDLDGASRSKSERRSRQDLRMQKRAQPAVPGSIKRLSQSELEQQVDLLRQENVALKERCKEIRLNLQRKITELQDTLTITKQKYMTELSELKVEYGKDLNRITRISEEKQTELEQQFDALKEEELEQLSKDFEQKVKDYQEKIVEMEKAKKEAVEEADHKVRDAEKDLKKLKGEQTGYFKGGWGTFIIAFEDEDSLNELLERKLITTGNMLSSPQQSPGVNQLAKKPTLKKPRKQSGNEKEKTPQSPRSNRSKDVSQADSVSVNDMTEARPHPIEKINHFIEVGFLIDKNNFRYLENFEEATYDSNLQKYLFELQDPLDNFQMNDLEFKVKQQLTDNAGLFNEINPVYISLNMGRPCTPFMENYVSQDQFRLIKREGVYLMQHRWMMINFLKCDYLTQQNADASPQNSLTINSNGTDGERAKSQNQRYDLRVIAFENSTSSQFSFDLNFNDLLTLMHGNIKLLEDENSHDLCQIILNNLSMIKRKKRDQKGRATLEDVLIVEHKIFFNEQYRAVYDKKNKNIMAKYDKKRQGLVKDVCLTTDYEKSVIYEAFSHVFEDKVNIQSSQRQDYDEVLGIEILRGKMSGNIKLRVTFENQAGMVKEMCLFAEQQQRSHKICSEIIHVGNAPQTKINGENIGDLIESAQDQDQSTLAYVISLEKLYGHEDILVVRLVLIEKWDQNVMNEYSWSPEGRPQEGSTQFNSQTLYLVKKCDQNYCRVSEYEILNTEVRTLLFMHSYGYIQSNVDFGNVRRYLEQGENRRMNYLSMIGNDAYLRELEQSININIRHPAPMLEYKGLNQLIFRQFCIMRVRREGFGKEGADQQSNRTSQNEANLRQRALKSNDGEWFEVQRSKNPNENLANYNALVAIFDDGKCIERGELVVKVVIQEMQVDVTFPVPIINEVVSEELFSQVLLPDRKTEVCEKIIDKLVLTEIVIQSVNILDETEMQTETKYLLQLEKDVTPMSDVIALSKQVTFEETLRHQEGRHDDRKINMEIPDVSSLKVSLQTLADCPRASDMTLINQKLYKVTAYFVSNHRSFEPAMPTERRMFDWHFVYVEVAQRSTDQQIVFGVTEKDIVSIVQKFRQKMRAESKDVGTGLISRDMSYAAILNLILDCLIMDTKTFEVSLSMLHLNLRHQERTALEEKFVVTGGRFVHLQDGQDPEFADFKTVIPQTELTKKMIQNVQKDMSDKTFDVKIFELQLASMPGTKKIRFEVFWVDEPDVVFRCDMFSNENQDGTQIILEKINIVEQRDLQRVQKEIITEDQYDPSSFAKDGLVLAICESNFPHQVSFMLIEPCSHIQWEYSFQDDKLNVIETRQQRLNLISNLRGILSEGVLRGVHDKERAIRIQPGEQQLIGEEQVKDTMFNVGSIQQVFKSSRHGCQYELVYAQSIEIAPGIFKNINVLSDQKNDKLIMKMTQNDDTGSRHRRSARGDSDESPRAYGGQSNHQPSPALVRQGREIHVSMNSQMEGSRVASGCMSYLDFEEGNSNPNSHLKNLIYSIEVSCALKRQEKAVRISIFNQATQCSIVNVVFIDKSVFVRDLEMKDDVRFAMKSGYSDSMAIIQKMTYLNYDFQKFELNQEIKMKMDDGKSVDLMRDFKESESQKKPAGGSSRENGRKSGGQKSKDEDTAFMSLAKLKENILNRSLKNNTLLYRKVMKLDKGKKNIMISALREENQMYVEDTENVDTNQPSAVQDITQDKYLVKLVLFENKRVDHGQQPGPQAIYHNQGRSVVPAQGSQSSVQKSAEYVFVYRFSEMFSYDECKNNNLDDLGILKNMVAQAVNRRLRIREIPDILDIDYRALNKSGQKKSGDAGRTYDSGSFYQGPSARYIAFFLDEKQIHELPMNPAIQKLDLLEGREEFDMRQLHSFALLDPSEKVVPTPEKKASDVSLQKQNLIYQFEKDDLLFEVFEILNPSQLTFRFKVYERETFKMLTSCDIGEVDLKSQLAKDRRSYLSGPQQREELAKYIIMNSFYDEQARSLKFMVSDLMEELES